MDSEVQAKTRPLFSVVVSCYNSRETIGRVLSSLTKQGLDPEELEVIISDDCSTEPYDDIVDSYRNFLQIKRVNTDYNCCPGNTRQRGLENATGVWVTFSDHDDEYVEGALGKLRDMLDNELKTEQFYIVTSFYKQNDFIETKSTEEMLADHSGGWTHGKFYNLDNFIKRFDLHFKKDLMSNEDIYFTTSVNCILDYLHAKHLDAGIFVNELFTYIWYSHPRSLSHTLYDDGKVTFFERTFLDYAESTGDRYLQSFKDGILPWDKARYCIIDTILLYYFYTVYFLYDNPNNYLKENFDYVKGFLKDVKETFHMTNKEIWTQCTEFNCTRFKEARDYAEIATGIYIPSMTLTQWLHELSPDEDDEKLYLYYRK